MKPFDFTDYKTFLKDCLHEKKTKISGRFTFERMAAACKVQKTYLSRVLNSDNTHLNDDQLFMAARYLGLSQDEQTFLFLLRDHDKTTLNERKQEIKHHIDAQRRRAMKSENYLSAEPLKPNIDVSAYHLDPLILLTHIFLAVDRFREDPRRICEFLNISEQKLTTILSQLERLNYIEFDGKKYSLTKQNTHLSTDSPLFHPYRVMQRLVALERIQKLPKERTYNFSVTFSANETARMEIQKKFLSLLTDIEKLVTNASDEQVYQMNFDLFDWSMPL